MRGIARQDRSTLPTPHRRSRREVADQIDSTATIRWIPHMPNTATLRRPELRTALCKPAASRYPIDESLNVFVDRAVDACRARRESLDDTIDAVAALIRPTAPNELAQSDPEWEARWRSYFAFYDHAVMHAIRAYVERDAGDTSIHQH
jgi:hypothetical protein